jgi:branched-chain amino acid transport system substrate-binding protein
MSFTREDPNPAARAFVAAFRRKFNIDPEAHAALAYDATKLVARALSEVGGDRKAVRDYLHALTEETAVDGITGPAFFEDSGDPVGIRFRVGRVQSGRLKVADSQ